MTIIGLDIGGTNIRAGIVEGDTVHNIISQTFNGDVEQIYAIVDKLMSNNVEGIGVGVPASVTDDGVIPSANNIPQWNNVPLRHLLEERFKKKTMIDNDANCFALGECIYGEARGYKHIVGLILGTGVGSGIVIDGKIYRGKHNAAGEIGQVRYVDSTVEEYCSGKFFTNQGSTGEELLEKARHNDAHALSVFATYGMHLGNALSTIVHVLSPQVIVLGGSVAQPFEFFEQTMRDALLSSIPQRLADIRIVPSKKEHMGLLGAAALIRAK